MITLAITPLRRLSPRSIGSSSSAVCFGLFAFFYASLHMLTYVALYSGFDVDAMETDITKRRFITMGVPAYLLLLPLALTSTTWAIRKLGGKNWNRLHKLIYVAAICGVIHYWWQVKTGVLKPLRHHPGSARCFTGVGPVLAWTQRRKARAPPFRTRIPEGLSVASVRSSCLLKHNILCATGLKLFRCSGVGPSRRSASRCSATQ